MEHQFRRQVGTAVVRVVRAALQPFLVNVVAHVGDVVERVALGHVGLDFRLRAHAVPNAHFIDPSLEVVAVVLPRGFRPDVDCGELLGVRADEQRARVVRVAVHAVVGAVRVDFLQRHDEAVRGNEVGVGAVDVASVDVEDELVAVEGQGQVRPLVGLKRVALDRGGAEALRAAVRHGVVGVELAPDAAAGLHLDAEVGAQLVNGVGERARGVVAQARKDRLVAGEVLGTHPAFDGERAEHRVVLADAAVELAGVGLHHGFGAREVHRLAAVGIGAVQRAGRAGHGVGELLLVGDPVVVSVVAFVLLEGEQELVHAARILAVCAGEPKIGGEVRDVLALAGLVRVAAVVLRGDTDLRGGVRHPQRRRVGVVVHRVGQVHEQGFVRVAQAVAVGVRLGHAHRPREPHRVVNEFGLLPVRPCGAAGAEQLLVAQDGVVRLGDHVLAAQQRVQAVEQFVVVVHAVAVGIPVARVGADVARGAHAVFVVSRGNVAKTPRRLEEASVLRHREVPRLLRGREVAELPVLEAVALTSGKAREPGGARRAEERRAVPDLHRQEADVLARAGDAVGQVAAHERGFGIVVAEVAEHLHEVFLEVVESVVVEVEVAAGAGSRVNLIYGRNPERVVVRAVHAVRDVGADYRLVAEVVVTLDDLDDVRVDALEACAGGNRHARVLAFPAVGQEVEVCIDAARVEAATANAPGAVVRRVAVYERVAFGSVAQSVLIAIAGLRIGRGELVEPALCVAGVVLVDRRRSCGVGGILVGVAGVGAGVFVAQAQAVAVAIADSIVGVVGVGTHVQFPTVGDAVLIGVGTVVGARVGGN